MYKYHPKDKQFETVKQDLKSVCCYKMCYIRSSSNNFKVQVKNEWEKVGKLFKTDPWHKKSSGKVVNRRFLILKSKMTALKISVSHKIQTTLL